MTVPAAVKRLRQWLDTLEPQMQREIARALRRLQAMDLDQLIAAIESGDQMLWRRVLGRFETDLQQAVTILERAFIAGSAASAATVGTVVARGKFALTNPFATQAARTSAAKLVTRVSAETRQAIRSIITRAFTEGITPRDTAKLIRPLVGLTKRQALAVMNRRALLISQGVKDEVIAKRIATYAAKLLKQRALMIARTELIRASVDGQLALWKDAQDKGLLRPDAKKQWLITPDDRLCPICEQMDSQQQPIAQPFILPDGSPVAGPPAHPNCRCAVHLVARVMPVRQAA